MSHWEQEGLLWFPYYCLEEYIPSQKASRFIWLMESPGCLSCKAETELLHRCSGVCATTAAAAKGLQTVTAALADHCTDFLLFLGKSLLSHTWKHQKAFPQALVMLSCCSSLWEAKALASVTITLCFTQFTEFKECKLTSVHSFKIPPMKHISVRYSEVSDCCRLYLTQAATGW